MTRYPGGESTMKLLRVVGFASLFAATITLVAAPASAFTSGGWEGQANNDEDGSFRDCTMTADYANGITLALIISRDYGWGLVLANDKWELHVGSNEAVTLAIDQRAPIPGTAKVVDMHGILIPLENADPVVEAMRHGHTLSIIRADGKMSFKLSGTRAAIAALANCVSEHLEAEKAGGIEAKATDDSKDNGNKLFTPSEAADYASHLLAAAGITNYQLAAPDTNPMPSFDVVWTYANGIIAALVAYKNMGATDLDEEANVVMADDAKNCKGDFNSGKKISEPEDGVNVKRLYTVCRSTGRSVEIHYTLVKTESGHLIQIAHLNMGDATGDVANADSPFLHGVALRSFK
jgi:hypothetical protein